MAGSVNKVILVGNLGRDPEIRTMQSGDKVVNLSIATSESWKDKASGERKEKTEWHRVVIFNQNIVKVCESYLKKGAKVYVEGQLETRSWEQDGQKKYTTEVVIKAFNGQLTMLDSRGESSGGFQDNTPPASAYESEPRYAAGSGAGGGSGGAKASARVDELEDEIPF